MLHCGMAEIAVPSPGVFYPPNWLFACLPYGQAFALLMILHQCAAGLFALLLVLELGWGEPAAFCAGIIVAFCGYMFSLITNYTLMATAAWVPMNFWVVLSLGRAQNRKEIYSLVCLGALAFFLLIAAGRPELSVPAALSIALVICLMEFLPKDKDQTNSTGKLSNSFAWQWLFLFIGLLLSSPVILPAAEWLLNSPRAQGLTIDIVFLWSANWYDFVSMVFAQPFGDITSIGSPYLNLAASRSGYLPYVPSPLVGPVALTLAVWGITDTSWKERKWVLLIFSLSILMLLGSNAFIFPQLLMRVPCINLFRYPIKLIIIPIFLVAFAAARGFNCLTRPFYKDASPWPAGQDVKLSNTAAQWFVGLLIGCCFTIAGLLAMPLPVQPISKSSAAQLMLGQSLMLGSFIGLIICALVYLYNKQKISLRLLVIGINGLLLLSLYLPALRYRAETIASDFYFATPFVLQQINKLDADNNDGQKQRILLLYHDPLAMPTKYAWRKDSSYTANYYAYSRDMLIPNTNLDCHQPMTLGYEAAETGDYRKLSSDLVRRVYPASNKVQISARDYLALWHFCRASASRWLCGQIRNGEKELPALADGKHFQMVCESDDMNLRIYRVKNALPRAFVCQKWSWAVSHKGALSCLGGVTANDFDPENAALIERLPAESTEYPVLLPSGYCTDQSASPLSHDGPKPVMPSNAVITQAGVIYPGAKSFASAPHLQSPVFLKDLPEHISISLNLDKDNFLILADKFYPGWTASVDGLKTPIFRANGCFRAVYVPRGGHLIQFDYEPLSLTIGLYCALAGSCLIGWLLLSALSSDALRMLRRMAGEEI